MKEKLDEFMRKLAVGKAYPASPSEGDIYMDATTHKLMVYDGTQWRACW